MPIYASRDHGKTWKFYSQVEDTAKGHGLRSQPMMYALPVDVADLPAGTLLFTANAIPPSGQRALGESAHAGELRFPHDSGRPEHGMCTVEDGSKLLQLAPTQCDPRLLQLSCGIAKIEEETP